MTEELCIQSSRTSGLSGATSSLLSGTGALPVSSLAINKCVRRLRRLVWLTAHYGLNQRDLSPGSRAFNWQLTWTIPIGVKFDPCDSEDESKEEMLLGCQIRIPPSTPRT